jgi:hypothetical protein
MLLFCTFELIPATSQLQLPASSVHLNFLMSKDSAVRFVDVSDSPLSWHCSAPSSEAGMEMLQDSVFLDYMKRAEFSAGVVDTFHIESCPSSLPHSQMIQHYKNLEQA